MNAPDLSDFFQRALPQSDADVMAVLDTDYADDGVRQALRGLYQCYRAGGDDVLTAFEKMLRKHIETAKSVNM